MFPYHTTTFWCLSDTHHSLYFILQFAFYTLSDSNIPTAINFKRSKTRHDKARIYVNPIAITQEENAKYDSLHLHHLPCISMIYIVPICLLCNSKPAQMSHFIVPPAVALFCIHKVQRICQHKVPDYMSQRTKEANCNFFAHSQPIPLKSEPRTYEILTYPACY